MRRFGWRIKLGVVLGAPLLVLGLAELGLRLAGYRYDSVAARTRATKHVELGDPRLFLKHPKLIWTLRPSTVIDSPDDGFRSVRTNSLGLRGGEVNRKKEPGELRVLCLGDSVTFGYLLRDHETYPVHLAEALRRRPELAGRPLTVINGGVPGWSSVQGIRLYRELEWVDADVVVFWFGMNDVKMTEGLPDREYEPPDEGTRIVMRALQKLRVFQLGQATMARVRNRPESRRRVSEDDYGDAVATLMEEVRSAGRIPIFVRYPECLGATIRQLAAVERRAREEGVEHIRAPFHLLSPYAPVGDEVDLTGRRILENGAPIIVFEEAHANAETDLVAVRSYLDLLNDWKATLERYRRTLPDGSPGEAELFGSHRPIDVFMDNCHLRDFGTRLAGEALADLIVTALED